MNSKLISDSLVLKCSNVMGLILWEKELNNDQKKFPKCKIPFYRLVCLNNFI